MLNLDLSTIFDWRILFSFFFGAILCFLLGVVGSQIIFNCTIGESIAIGFCILFSNAVLLGLPITELAYGKNSLGPNLAIISVNAPICYLIGISAMELFGTETKSLKKIIKNIFRTVTSNNITMSLIIGLLFNYLEIQIFPTINIALDFISVGAVPIALFGLGGIIVQYQLSQNMKKVGLISMLSLVIHPLLTFTIGKFGFDLPLEVLRNMIITAAMAPGINAFIFASIYDKEMDVAAATVLVCTPLSICAASVWISLL
jgi:predicted permease